MLAKIEYDELVKFRVGPVERQDGPTPMIQHFVSMKFIKVIDTNIVDGFSIRDVKWAIEPLGEIALDDYENQVNARAKSEARARKRFRITIAISIISAVAAIMSAVISAMSLWPVPNQNQNNQDSVCNGRYYLEHENDVHFL